MLLPVLLLTTLLSVTSASVTFEITDRWYGGFRMVMNLNADHAMTSWTVNLCLSGPVDSLQCDWMAHATQVSTNHWRLTNLDFNGNLAAGQTLSGVIVVSCATECVSGNQYTLDLNEGECTVHTQSTTVETTRAIIHGLPKDYSDALKKSILFFDAQRSGKLPANNPIPWRGDSALTDCVVGGWYDAGDHVKFGLPFGAATHVLLWGFRDFKDGYQHAGQINQFYDMIKWATDYMINAYNPSTHELVAQIGDGDVDHAYWGPPEQMTMPRGCHKLGPGKPGSELYGEWAGSLAAAYLIFKDKGDTAYANKMLQYAENMYAFGKANPGIYTHSLPDGAKFYGSDDYKDEMCMGAIWLYRATGHANYLTDAKSFYKSGYSWAFNWGLKNVACQLFLYEETKDNRYKTDVEGFMSDWMPGGSLPYTPCGLVFRDKWGSNRLAANTAFIALAAAKAGIKPAEYQRWAAEQINYILGDNHQKGGCFSFEIGYGSNYPQHPHHRAASSAHQTLVGGLVGGPDSASGSYEDSQNNYVTNEVALDYNSGFQSALAALVSLGTHLPATHNKCPC